MDRPISLEARSIDLAIEPPFTLGLARIAPEAHGYTIGNKSSRMQPQMLRVLVALHDKRGNVVSRDELADRCWGGRIVGDDVINRCISLLRAFSAQSGGFHIETISGAGYRLLEKATDKVERRRTLWIAVGAAVAVAAPVGVAVLMELRPTATAAPLVEVEPLQTPADDRAALALAQGLAASVERNLVGSETPVEIIDGHSRKNASLIVRGTSITHDGQLRASVQLVIPRSGKVLWASNFVRPSNEFDELQDQLSLQVARILHCAYSNGRQPYFDSDMEFARLSLAHCDILGGQVDEAVRLDAQIVQRAPEFARGWSEYAIDSAFQSYKLPPSHQSAARRRAIALARHALALDPHQGLAYTAIGTATDDSSSWLDNERLARRALAADPKSPEAHNWQSGLLSQIGRLGAALNEAKISHDLDHFLPGKIDQLVRINIAAGNLDEAQDQLALARRNWPGNPWWDLDTASLGVAGKSPADGVKLLSTGQVRMSPPRQRALITFLQWRIAPTTANKRVAVNAIETASEETSPNAEQVILLAVLGEVDAAYQLAARSPPESLRATGWFNPELDTFRSDPRFMPLAARMGLAQIWLETGLWPDFCIAKRRLASCKAAAGAAITGIQRRNAPIASRAK